MIGFDLVPATARAKGVYIEPKNVLLSLGGLIAPRKIVCVGQYNDDKSPVDNAAKLILSEGQEDDLYGKGSMLALSIKRARQGSNSLIPIYALPVAPDVSGVKATGSITIGGTATQAGSIPFYIAGTRFTLAVANGDTGVVLTTNLATAINAILDLPVTANFSTPDCDVTAKNAGLVGNRIKIATNLQDDDVAIPTGLTVTIVQLVTGANDPNITNAIDGLGNEFYTDIHCPYSGISTLNILRDKYIERISPEFKKPFIGYVPNNQAIDDYVTTADALNTEAVSLIPTFESNTLDYLSSAWICGYAALWYQASPGRSFAGTAIPGVRVNSSLVNFNQGTKEQLVIAGATTMTITPDRQFAIADFMTTKKTNAIGGPEIDLSRTERISNIQTKIYSLDVLLSSEPFITGVVVDDSSTTSLSYAIRPKFVKGKIIQLVDELWIPLAISKNRDLIVQSIRAEINAGSGARIDVEIQDDLAVALDVLAVAYRFGIRGGQA